MIEKIVMQTHILNFAVGWLLLSAEAHRRCIENLAAIATALRARLTGAHKLIGHWGALVIASRAFQALAQLLLNLRSDGVRSLGKNSIEYHTQWVMMASPLDHTGNIDDLFFIHVGSKIAIFEGDCFQILCTLAKVNNVLPLDGAFANNNNFQFGRSANHPREIWNVAIHCITTDRQLSRIRKRKPGMTVFVGALIVIVVVHRPMQMNHLDAFGHFVQMGQPFRTKEIHFDREQGLRWFHVQRQWRPVDWTQEIAMDFHMKVLRIYTSY